MILNIYYFRLTKLREDLSGWAVENKCTRTSVDSLLRLLRDFGIDWPKDSRTLLKTPRTVNFDEKCNGQYIYFGIGNCLKQKLLHKESKSIKLSLVISIDGLPLFKSSSQQLWPILCNTNDWGIDVICLYCGTKKSEPVEDFLTEFIDELKELLSTGFKLNGKDYKVTLKAITCDAPARSFLKCVVGHTSYHGCERYTIKGDWTQGRITYNYKNLYEARTDEAFSQLYYTDHQKKEGSFIHANVPCVTLFIIDYMHLICLGVMKQILKFLKNGPAICHLSQVQQSLISNDLIEMKYFIPSDFSRKPRSLVEFDRWKAAEFRQFLLYT